MSIDVVDVDYTRIRVPIPMRGDAELCVLGSISFAPGTRGTRRFVFFMVYICHVTIRPHVPLASCTFF